MKQADNIKIVERIDSVVKFVQNEFNEARKQTGKINAYNAMNTRQLSQTFIRLRYTILELAPRSSDYNGFARSIKVVSPDGVAQLYGILKSLREEYASDYLRGIEELIDADLFADIVDQAEYLQQQGYVRASVVVVGVALESHLRKLAQKHSIPITNEGSYVKAESLNSELYKAEAYDKTFNKMITSWLGLRNDAAHPDSNDLNDGLIEPMIMGVRNFIEKYPA